MTKKTQQTVKHDFLLYFPRPGKVNSYVAFYVFGLRVVVPAQIYMRAFPSLMTEKAPLNYWWGFGEQSSGAFQQRENSVSKS